MTYLKNKSYFWCNIKKVINKKKITFRLIEFFIVGLVMGVTEDILAIHFATDATITLQTFKVALIVAIPFAVFSELVVDAKPIRRWVKVLLAKKFKKG